MCHYPHYSQIFPPGWCVIHHIEETHTHLCRQIATTTMDRVERVLVIMLLIFFPHTEWLTMHLSDSQVRSVEREQSRWARQAQLYMQGDSLTRLGEIIITISRVRQVLEIEELRVEL